MQRSKNGHLRLADRPADYKGFGIAPVEVAKSEDGQRIGVESGRYEWWYFDAHLDDGQVRPSLIRRPRAREALRLASFGAQWTGKRSLQDRQRGTPRLRQRIS
jgi:hypothetical protein